MPSLWISAASSSVRNSRLPYFAGRSIGVKLRLVQYPCRSGWPSGVRGSTQDFFCSGFVLLLAAVDDAVCAATHAGAHRKAAITITKRLNETPKRLPTATSFRPLLARVFVIGA